MAREIQIIGITMDEARVFLKGLLKECLREILDEAKTKADEPLSPSQVTRLLGISRPTLCKYVNMGLIRRHDLGQKKKVFYRSELEEDIKQIESISKLPKD